MYILSGKHYFKNYNGGHVMFMPNDLYVPIGTEIAFKCDEGLVFAHDINNDPIVYTICEPNGTVIRHGKIQFWPICVSRKSKYFPLKFINHILVNVRDNNRFR